MNSNKKWNALTIGEELSGPGLKSEVYIRVRLNGMNFDVGPVNSIQWESGLEKAFVVVGEAKEPILVEDTKDRNGYEESEGEGEGDES